MKVAIDTSPLKSAHRHRGIGSYTRSLIEALRRVDPKNEYVLTSKPHQAGADLIHYPYFDFFFPTLPFFKLKPSVVTIHDTIPLIFPHAYPPGIRGRFKFYYQQLSLRSVNAVITDSDQSKRDIVRYLSIPTDKIHRIYLAADPDFQPTTPEMINKTLLTYQIHQPYCLYVGDINYNKNIPGLIDVWAMASTTYQLVLVCRAMRDPIPQADAIIKQIADKHLEARITILSGVPLDPKNDIRALYAGAEWYIQPSLYEGFGLPVLEAIACGTPVILSSGGSLPEITPPGSITFNPTNLGSMVTAVETAFKFPEDRKITLISRAQQFMRQFTWEKTAKQTIAVYEKTWSQS